MASITDICNGALRKVGATRITSIDQGTREANFCNDRYDELRLALLEMHPWNFAVKRRKLAQLSSTPAIKFDYAYSLPSDYVRAVQVYADDEGSAVADHKLEDNRVLASDSEIWLLYVSNVADPNKMSPLFRDALSDKLAVEAASALAESNTLREQMQKQFEKTLRRARSADAQADLPDRLPIGTWVTNRTGRLSQRRWTW